MIKNLDTLVATSPHAKIYRTYSGLFFCVCECDAFLGLKITQSDAEQSWQNHWKDQPFCT